MLLFIVLALLVILTKSPIPLVGTDVGFSFDAAVAIAGLLSYLCRPTGTMGMKVVIVLGEVLQSRKVHSLRPHSFRASAPRQLPAWIGLVPKQHSSGGKNRLGNISKQGDRYLRGLFVAGALAVIRYAKIHGAKHRPWLTALLARRPTKVAAIALANKIARMVWAMMARGERYKEPVALAR